MASKLNLSAETKIKMISFIMEVDKLQYYDRPNYLQLIKIINLWIHVLRLKSIFEIILILLILIFTKK